MCESRYSQMRTDLALDADSNVLIISTEGDTDPLGFWDNIWG